MAVVVMWAIHNVGQSRKNCAAIRPLSGNEHLVQLHAQKLPLKFCGAIFGGICERSGFEYLLGECGTVQDDPGVFNHFCPGQNHLLH